MLFLSNFLFFRFIFSFIFLFSFNLTNFHTEVKLNLFQRKDLTSYSVILELFVFYYNILYLSFKFVLYFHFTNCMCFLHFY